MCTLEASLLDDLALEEVFGWDMVADGAVCGVDVDVESEGEGEALFVLWLTGQLRDKRNNSAMSCVWCFLPS